MQIILPIPEHWIASMHCKYALWYTAAVCMETIDFNCAHNTAWIKCRSNVVQNLCEFFISIR